MPVANRLGAEGHVRHGVEEVEVWLVELDAQRVLVHGVQRVDRRVLAGRRLRAGRLRRSR